MPSPWPKPVVFTAPAVPNFLWHVLAVAGIGYNSDYADTYQHTIASADLDYLIACRSQLSFAEGEGGDLAGLFTALPAWLLLSDPDRLELYFTTLDTALRDGSLTPFVDSFPDANWSDRFMADALEHPAFPDDREALSGTARRLADVYLRSWDAYESEVWPDAELVLLRRAEELQHHFDQTDYIHRWEEMLAIPFAADRYEIALCFANRNGPDYNSLGYDSNLIYYDKPFTRTCQFVSHEIGTHLLIDLYLDRARAGEHGHRALYSAYETLAMFFNRRLLNVDKLAYEIPQFDDQRHLKLYEQHYRAGISPAELLAKILES